MSKPDVRHLVPGTMDHYMMCCLQLRGYLPRLKNGMRLKPWQEVRRALHRADAACIYLTKHFYVPENQ